MQVDLPESWQEALKEELQAPYFSRLLAFVDEARGRGPVYPPEPQVFRAFRETPLHEVRVVLLGQDPYHGEGQAQGLCFSVPPGVALPPSLRNIFKELQSDLGLAAPRTGDLSAWAERGVLLLNTVLTVEASKAGSHQKQGWERFTDAAIRAVSARGEPCVFALWGKPAAQTQKLVDLGRHRVVLAAHPSPLSAHRGFLGARPFSAIQAALASLGQPALDFALPA